MDFDQWLLEKNILDGKIFKNAGSVIWLPEGIKLKQNFVNLIENQFTNSNFLQVQLPFLIPINIYSKQIDHYKGISKISFFLKTLVDKDFCFALRTTSETPFTYLFNFWIKKQSLPFQYFQTITVFRFEDKNKIKTLLRSWEINPFIESYSAVESKKDADKQIEKEIDIYEKILNDFAIPYMKTRRPLFDTFPEAKYTIAFDVILPNGDIYQICTVHNLGNSFAKAFDLMKDNKYVYQTSTGISGRALGIILILHKEKDQMILPYKLCSKDMQKKINDIKDYQQNLYSKAEKIKKQHICNSISIEEALNSNYKGVIERLHCNREQCMINIQKKINPNGQVLGIAYNQIQEESKKCEVCGKHANHTIRIAFGKYDFH